MFEWVGELDGGRGPPQCFADGVTARSPAGGGANLYGSYAARHADSICSNAIARWWLSPAKRGTRSSNSSMRFSMTSSESARSCDSLHTRLAIACRRASDAGVDPLR